MFRFIEHTADMGLEARAPTCVAVLEDVARGLAKLIFGESLAAVRDKREFSVQADEPVELLVGWLNEIIYWCEKDNFVPAEIRVVELNGNTLSATMTGEVFDPSRHSVERHAKSATYHQACLEQAEQGWLARVYIDL